jgi:uncharacterized membrane protein YfcA
MHPGNYLLLAGAGVLAGGLNAVAGGGSFITIPALMFTGSTPILSNTNSTIATWPGIVSSFYAYRRRMAGTSHPIGLYALLALIGGSVGAGLLLFTSNEFFIALLPWLLLTATALLIFGNRVTAWATGTNRHDGATLPDGISYALLFVIAVYGGYFGGGMGIMTLAVFTVMGMRDMHEMNALKVMWTSMINGVAVVIFLATGKVEWLRCLTMMAGAITGGYLMSRFALRIPRLWLRRFVITIAVGMTAYYFAHVYL